MNTIELIVADDGALYSIEHVAAASGLTGEDIADLVECGAIAAAGAAQPYHFEAQVVLTIQSARRLRDDFSLDRHGLALALTLLRRINELEAQLGHEKARRGG
jgi:chaperone modulatory protein CbpM